MSQSNSRCIQPSGSPVGMDAPSELSKVVERNIEALLERRAGDEKSKGFQDRLADGINAFAGSMRLV